MNKLVELRPCVCFAIKVMHIEGVGEEDKQSNESVGVDRQPMVMTFCAGPELETDSLRFAQVVHVHVHRVPSRSVHPGSWLVSWLVGWLSQLFISLTAVATVKLELHRYHHNCFFFFSSYAPYSSCVPFVFRKHSVLIILSTTLPSVGL